MNLAQSVRILHNVRMNEENKTDPTFTREMFKETFDIVKKKSGGKYDDIVKGGSSLHNALFRLYEVVWNNEVKPDSWRDSLVIQLEKGKGLRADLNSKRHIHTRPQIPKYFSHILASATKPIILESISPFQIGAVPGHRAQEHIFTLKSVMTMKEKKTKT